MQSGPPGALNWATDCKVVRSILWIVLATRLLTKTWRPSPKARNAWAPSPVGIFLTNLGCGPETSKTSTPSEPVKPTNRYLSSAVPNTSAGISPVLKRHLMVWVAKSTATNSLLSCMVAKAMVLLLSIQIWLGVLPEGMRLAKANSLPSQR